MAGQRQGHQHGREQRIGRAHHGEKIAVTDAVAGHAKQRGNQRADVTERGEHRQQQHRPGLDQHVPAENQRLHLESPGGEQVGGPLETVVPDTEGGERGRPREIAQNPTPRFIAFHPCPVSCWDQIYRLAAAGASPAGRKTPVDRPPAAAVQAADTASSRRACNNSCTSAHEIAGLNRYPCISVQPSSRSNSICGTVSTPSAVVVMLLAAAMFTMAWTIADDPAGPAMSLTKQRSILILSKGKRCR